MGLFTTRQLLGYTEQKVKFRALFLELFFRRTVSFHTEEVMLDKITGKTPVAAYVSPVVEGKVLRHRGGETRVLRPGYVKPKHEFNYQQAVERLPGEDPAQLNDPAYRRLRIITDNLKQEEHAIIQVEELQAVNAVLYGKYTMEGEQFEKIEVDFGRSTKNNITQGSGGGNEWSKQNSETFDPTHDIDMYCDQASGVINIAIMDGKVWRILNGFKLFREKLDTKRGSTSQMETALKDLGSVVSFKGYYGDVAIVVAKTSYVAADGKDTRYLPEGTLILGNTGAEGIRCYGAIKDAQALSEGVVASSRYPKHWLTVGDPSCEFTMTQSAPLMVLPDPDEFVVVQVK
ncbi:major capsid protein [Escherichia coli]|nr:major capsid protein [Escherichia coli]